MCLDAICFPSSSPTMILSSQQPGENFEWRLFKCAFEALSLIGATVSGFLYVNTGVPTLLIISVGLGALFITLLTQEDPFASPSCSSAHRITTATIPVFQPSPQVTPIQILPSYSYNVIQHPPVLPVHAPVGRSSAASSVFDGTSWSCDALSTPTGHAPVGRRAEQQPLYPPLYSSPIGGSNIFSIDPYSISANSGVQHAPVGQRSQTTDRSHAPVQQNEERHNPSSGHAPVGRREN